MENRNMKISVGVEALLANAHAPAPSGKYYTFEGDLNQMSKAAEVARMLGFQVGVSGGLPYVCSEEEYNKVVRYIVTNQIEGYWNYDTVPEEA